MHLENAGLACIGTFSDGYYRAKAGVAIAHLANLSDRTATQSLEGMFMNKEVRYDILLPVSQLRELFFSPSSGLLSCRSNPADDALQISPLSFE